MKLQCSCGVKYEFDIAPAMVTNPVRFVCPACGVDASEFVDSLVRRELGQTASPSGVPQPVLVAASPAPGGTPAPAAPGGVRVAATPRDAPLVVRRHTSQPAAAPTEPAADSDSQECSKHPGQVAAEKCYICSKPICPKCMELFGYVCSPLCRAKAEARGITIPTFAGQKSVVERRYWRKVGRGVAVIGGVVLLLLGLWFWFAWFGSEPKPVFSVRFAEAAYSGQSFICGKDQIVFLHGGTLARHDLKQKKAVWSRELLDHKQLEVQAAAWLKEMEASYSRSEATYKVRPPTLDKLTRRVERNAAAALELYVRGQNVWVASPGKLVRYEWDTGNPAKEVPLKTAYGRLKSRGDELLVVDTESGRTSLTHINLATCDVQTEDPSRPTPSISGAGTNAGGGGAGGLEMAGLPMGLPGKDAGKALDPAKVAEQAQRLSYPARLALPATLAANLNQERALKELNSENDRPVAVPGPRARAITENASLVPDRDGFVQFSVGLLESRITERTAVKAAPKTSALDHLTVGNTTDAANEMLNEIQHTRGGDTVQEDESRYQVTLRRPGQAGFWSGEVIGPPTLYPLQTVNVLAANKLIVVFDKANKKLWQSSLSFNVHGGLSALEPDSAPNGQGPCIERGKALYVFDDGVLTAFDLATGAALWRLPSVGISGLFFDDKEMLYVNTTTAGPDSLKYSRQIDISQKTRQVVLKVDARKGTILWDVEPGGPINYVSGKFLYTVAFYQAEETDDDSPYSSEDSKAPFLRIRRISPKNGHVIWEHGQPRAPLDIQFDKNVIRLVFKKEVQVLRFLTF